MRYLFGYNNSDQTFYRIHDLEPDKFNTERVAQKGRIQINHVANPKNQNTYISTPQCP